MIIIFTFTISILWYVKLDDHVSSAVRASLVIAILPEPEPITSLNLKQPTHLYVTELYPYIYIYILAQHPFFGSPFIYCFIGILFCFTLLGKLDGPAASLALPFLPI